MSETAQPPAPAPVPDGTAYSTPPAAQPPGAPSALEAAGTVEGKGETKTEAKPVELKAPKGFESHFEALQQQAKELGLEGEKAQKYLDSLANIDAARSKQLDEALAAQDAKWAAELKADPEVGGEKFASAVKDAAKALSRFGGTPTQGQKVAPLAVLLHQAGLGNHPLVLKAFAAIGRAMADDTISGTATPAAPDAGRKSDAELFYGTPTDSKEQ